MVDEDEHRLRHEPAVRTESGYRAHCRCGTPFDAATLGAAHDLVFAHVRAKAGRELTRAELRQARELARMAEQRGHVLAPVQVAGVWGQTFKVQAEPHTVEAVIAALDELGRFSLPSVAVERYVAEQTGELIGRAVVQVLEERFPPQRVSESTLVEFRRPASWWDHFKLTYGGRWWLRMVRPRPVRWHLEQRAVEVTVELDRSRLFPKADIRPPTSFGPPVEWWRWKAMVREVRS